MLEYWYIERGLFEWEKKNFAKDEQKSLPDCRESIRKQILLSCRKII